MAHDQKDQETSLSAPILRLQNAVLRNQEKTFQLLEGESFLGITHEEITHILEKNKQEVFWSNKNRHFC